MGPYYDKMNRNHTVEAKQTMHRIIIGDGLSNEYLSPQHQNLTARDNDGLRESARLLGRGKRFGDGPVPNI